MHCEVEGKVNSIDTCYTIKKKKKRKIFLVDNRAREWYLQWILLRFRSILCMLLSLPPGPTVQTIVSGSISVSNSYTWVWWTRAAFALCVSTFLVPTAIIPPWIGRGSIGGLGRLRLLARCYRDTFYIRMYINAAVVL